MKKLIIFSFILLILMGCSSSNEKFSDIQMESLKWTLPVPESIYEEEEVIKQMNLFELVPGKQVFRVQTFKDPGTTSYLVEMLLKVKLKHRVNIDIDKILSSDSDLDLIKSVANIDFLLLDRNGERISVESTFGPQDIRLIMFNQREFCTEWFIDYVNFLKSEPGTEFELYGWADFSEPEDKCKIGFSNLPKEVKGVELRMDGSDENFEKYVGVIE